MQLISTALVTARSWPGTGDQLTPLAGHLIMAATPACGGPARPRLATDLDMLLLAALATATAAEPSLAAVPSADLLPYSLQDAAAPAASAQQTTKTDRAMLMEANFRYRYLSVPDSIMDVWFFDSDDQGANGFDRPQVRMYAVGVEYVLKPRPSNWIFYYEYIGSLIEEGYWDDVEEPAEHDDGDWVRPERLGLHVVGANYAHEIEVTDGSKDVWLSMLFGAGLGVGVVVGEMQTWNPGGNASIENDCLRQSPAYERKEECPVDSTKRIPGLLPIVDLTASFRVNFADRANLRIDGGIHDMFYLGAAAGGVF